MRAAETDQETPAQSKQTAGKDKTANVAPLLSQDLSASREHETIEQLRNRSFALYKIASPPLIKPLSKTFNSQKV